MIDGKPNCMPCAQKLQKEWEDNQRQQKSQQTQHEPREEGNKTTAACKSCGADVEGLAFCEGQSCSSIHHPLHPETEMYLSLLFSLARLRNEDFLNKFRNHCSLIFFSSLPLFFFM